MFTKTLAALLALTLLAACEGSRSLDTLRLTEPQGDAYQLALASNYRDLAELRAIDYDWGSSNFFAEKGLRAARGQEVEPEDSSDWALPNELREEFVAARTKLMATIKENRSTQPELTASAVVAYDHWLVAQHS